MVHSFVPVAIFRRFLVVEHHYLSPSSRRVARSTRRPKTIFHIFIMSHPVLKYPRTFLIKVLEYLVPAAACVHMRDGMAIARCMHGMVAHVVAA